MKFSLGLLSLLAVATPLVSAEHVPVHRRHNGIAKRASGDIQLHKRFSNARFTFYDVGLGACGINNVPSDFIVALNSAQYGGGYPGPHCFAMITITVNGKTAQAQITDECPGCPYGGLDFSRGLFDHFADESVGVLYGEWSFNDGSSDPTTSSTHTTHKTTSTWKAPSTTSTWEPPSTTSTWEPPSTTSTWEAPTTTSSKKHKSSTSSTWSSSSSSWSSSSSSEAPSSSAPPSSSSAAPSSSAASSSAVSSSAAAVVSSTPEDPEIINAMNQAMMGISGLIVAGAL
ncbi:hypothetical protein PUNSTDRAFT_103565 [Punctularia strigosozonata HHB-11173 SS5]|uniref:uncharacterized protein n=1 Tax=Punctularia strigosozonata (strain HHB-11173) TaxID=741275 RepID=UPI0004417355|nr:uncharacterized protein PUNSTDRAFT_103565 [Punctularia strigosozonata HHB-11173 SS5]EIN07546.1 hypothetical protein PUNSTDRAFT_103565 [Punctularia strigosozonata HHB-11173 SS5]